VKKKKDENIETTENTKKSKKAPIIAFVLGVAVIVAAANSGNSSDNDNEVKSSSGGSISSSLKEPSATDKITEEPTTKQTTEYETTASDIDISPETFVSTVKEAIQGAVNSSDEHITDVDLTDGTLIISIDLSEADTTIVPSEDLAVIRAQSITDNILEFEQYDDLWNKIVIDFGNVGLISRTSDDIIENEYGMRCFEIYELDSE